MARGKQSLVAAMRRSEVELSMGRERTKRPYYNEQGDFAGWVHEATGSSLLRGLVSKSAGPAIRRSQPGVKKLAAKVWADVTSGDGVVLDAEGKEVKPG